MEPRTIAEKVQYMNDLRMHRLASLVAAGNGDSERPSQNPSHVNPRKRAPSSEPSVSFLDLGVLAGHQPPKSVPLRVKPAIRLTGGERACFTSHPGGGETQKTVLSSKPCSAPQPSPPSHWPKGQPRPTDKSAFQEPGCEDQYELDLKAAIAASLRDMPAQAAVVSNPKPVRADISSSKRKMSRVQEPGQHLP
eukprot:EG_transcript_31832